MATPCPCTSKKCSHATGTCGKPVPNPQEIESGDASGADFKPVAWAEKGICEECYKRNRRMWDAQKIKEFVRKVLKWT